MQPLGLSAANLAAYRTRLFGSHDFRIELDVLDLNEQVIGSANLTDGQVNIQDSSNTVRRTASLVISDPDGALDFTGASEWSGTTVWCDRLVRVRHILTVPGLGDVTAIPFIGPPSTLQRQDSEVTLEAQDKTALAMYGAPPYSVAKGTNAVTAIRDILTHCTGEFRFRFPASTRRLSKPYAVGWDDATSPWAIATQIAKNELGWQLIYSCDGYALLRPTPGANGLTVPNVTSTDQAQVDFTTVKNWVRVLGKATSTTSGKVTTTTQPQSIVQVGSGNVSPQSLARKGVWRYLPVLVSNDAATNTTQTQNQAVATLADYDRLQRADTFACIPFFDADVDDLIGLKVASSASTSVRFNNASIPLGVAGDMSIGKQAWVSALPSIKKTSRKVTTRKAK